MKYLQSILNEFNNIIALIDKLFIWYFQDSLRPSIQAQLDKKHHDLIS